MVHLAASLADALTSAKCRAVGAIASGANIANRVGGANLKRLLPQVLAGASYFAPKTLPTRNLPSTAPTWGKRLSTAIWLLSPRTKYSSGPSFRGEPSPG